MILRIVVEEHHITDEQSLSYRFDSMEYEDMTSKELDQEFKTKILNTTKT
jgi:hypothetical protein